MRAWILVLSLVVLYLRFVETSGQPANQSPVIGWVVGTSKSATNLHRRYVLPSDECYKRLKNSYKKGNLIYFADAASAEAKGFRREVLGIKTLNKYCDVCSVLYDFYLETPCDKLFLNDKKEAESLGFSRIEDFGNSRYFGPAAAYKDRKIYFTECEREYFCVMKKNLTSLPSEWLCDQKRPTISFDNENEAKELGYVWYAEYLYSEFRE